MFCYNDFGGGFCRLYILFFSSVLQSFWVSAYAVSEPDEYEKKEWSLVSLLTTLLFTLPSLQQISLRFRSLVYFTIVVAIVDEGFGVFANLTTALPNVLQFLSETSRTTTDNLHKTFLSALFIISVLWSTFHRFKASVTVFLAILVN